MLADGYLPRDVLRQLRIRKAALAELLGYHNKSVAAVPVPYATGYRWPRPLDLL